MGESGVTALPARRARGSPGLPRRTAGSRTRASPASRPPCRTGLPATSLTASRGCRTGTCARSSSLTSWTSTSPPGTHVGPASTTSGGSSTATIGARPPASRRASSDRKGMPGSRSARAAATASDGSVREAVLAGRGPTPPRMPTRSSKVGGRLPASGRAQPEPHVADLAGAAGRAGVDRAAEVDREAEAGAGPQQREGGQTAAGAVPALPHGGELHVVLDDQLACAGRRAADPASSGAAQPGMWSAKVSRSAAESYAAGTPSTTWSRSRSRTPAAAAGVRQHLAHRGERVVGAWCSPPRRTPHRGRARPGRRPPR